MATQTESSAQPEQFQVKHESEVAERVSLGAVHGKRIFTPEDSVFESSVVAVLRNRIKAGEVNERHVHPDIEKVYYLLQGECEIECGPWKRHGRAGDFIFFPAAIHHQIRSLGPDDLEFIVIQMKVLGTPRGLPEGQDA